MSAPSFRVDSAAARACVWFIGLGGLVAGAALAYRATSLQSGVGELVAAGALGLIGALFAAAALRWKKVTANRDGLDGLAPNGDKPLPWSEVEEIWETYLSQRQPWPQRMVVRTATRSYRVWTTRPAIARCRELAGLPR